MPERGFTLLEIMLVIFLIGLASAGVVQTFATDSESPAKKAAQDFLTRFAQFKDRAVIEGKTLGVLIDPPGYQFMQYGSCGSPPYWLAAGSAPQAPVLWSDNARYPVGTYPVRFPAPRYR